MSASEFPVSPFNISVHDPKPQLREMHLTFTPAFKKMSVNQRSESLHAHIASMIDQVKLTTDTSIQQGLMIVIDLTEQILPHIESDSLPLNETLIVEMGEDADGASLEELLS